MGPVCVSLSMLFILVLLLLLFCFKQRVWLQFDSVEHGCQRHIGHLATPGVEIVILVTRSWCCLYTHTTSNNSVFARNQRGIICVHLLFFNHKMASLTFDGIILAVLDWSAADCQSPTQECLCVETQRMTSFRSPTTAKTEVLVSIMKQWVC